MTTDLEERYGAAPGWQRPVTLSLVALLAAVSLGWLTWAVWFHGNPEVESALVSFEVQSDHETAATLDVDMADGVNATCRVRAYAEDHTAVGELAFSPVHGANDVVVRTVRRATSVAELGCTTTTQNRPR